MVRGDRDCPHPLVRPPVKAAMLSRCGWQYGSVIIPPAHLSLQLGTLGISLPGTPTSARVGGG